MKTSASVTAKHPLSPQPRLCRITAHNQVSQKKKVKIVFLTKDTGTTAIERSDAPYYDFDNVNYYMDAKAIRIAGGLLEGTYLIASFTGNKLVLKEENSYTCTITLQRQY